MAKAGEKIYEWDRHPQMLMTAFQTRAGSECTLPVCAMRSVAVCEIKAVKV